MVKINFSNSADIKILDLDKQDITYLSEMKAENQLQINQRQLNQNI